MLIPYTLPNPLQSFSHSNRSGVDRYHVTKLTMTRDPKSNDPSNSDTMQPLFELGDQLDCSHLMRNYQFNQRCIEAFYLNTKAYCKHCDESSKLAYSMGERFKI